MNPLVAASVSRTRTVLTTMVLLILAGITSYVAIPKEADPDIPIPFFFVTLPYPGISPEDGERLLVKPMETELRTLEGLKEITAFATQGMAGIILEFDVDFDKDDALQDVRERVDLARAEIPAEAEEPVVTEFNTSLFPVLAVAISGEVPERTLLTHARRLQDAIESVPTVLEAKLVGDREELLEVIIDPVKLESYDVSQRELINAVSLNNQLVAAGALDTGQGRFNVKVPGLFESREDVMSLAVKSSGEGVVTLDDIAEIRRTFKDADNFARFNGGSAIVIEVTKRLGTNIIHTNNAVRAVVAAETAGWPDDINITFTQDQSSWIFRSINSLEASIITAISLVMIVVVAALGMRSAILVGIAIPTSFLIGFFLLALSGLTLNMMVMFGLLLAVGMLVDGAIVIVEYADRKMSEGVDRAEAYMAASSRMFWPIISSTATTLAAFLPMLLWPGVSGQFMSYLPMTLIFVLIASLVTALIFLPVLGSIFGKAEAVNQATLRMLSGAESGDVRALEGMTGIYVRMLDKLIRRPVTVMLAALGVLVSIFFLYGAFNNGVEFFVETEPEQAAILVSARGNLSATEMRDLVVEVERIVLAVEGVESAFSQTGPGQGGPGQGGDAPADMIGRISIELAPYEQRRPGAIILEEIRQKTKNIPGLHVEVRKREDGPPTGKDVQIQLSSNDAALLRAETQRVRDHLENNVDDLIDIEDSLPLPGIEWVLKIDREQAGRFGADVSAVGAMVQMVTNGILVGTYRPNDADDEVDIRARFPVADRSIDQLDQLRLRTPNGLVPLSNFVTREPAKQVNEITRIDGIQVMDVKANTVEGVLADTKVTELKSWIENDANIDPRVNVRFRGADENQAESAAFLGNAMIAALFLMFIILLTQFNSFYHSVLTLSAVIMSTMGVLLGMVITGQTFSVIMTGTGIVALAGIVVNNNIVLIDTFQSLLARGMDPIEAVLRTAGQRLRPVLLTTITTICGLLPMATQINVGFFDRSVTYGGPVAVWWVQLSTAIISGLSFATLLTLVVTPVMLAAPVVLRESAGGWRDWVMMRLGREPARERGRYGAAE
ncbi:efflux RND transporter permease subunit [Pyruvatibacter sp.]|uniref:efflux RND transporter permease subunit n=1 Tax=Pyruvatibacter sp. TaxID=1981328 RepID=UPI0032EC0FA3